MKYACGKTPMIGDKVRCIETDTRNNWIGQGSEYTVQQLDGADNTTGLEDASGWHSLQKFELISRANPVVTLQDVRDLVSKANSVDKLACYVVDVCGSICSITKRGRFFASYDNETQLVAKLLELATPPWKPKPQPEPAAVSSMTLREFADLVDRASESYGSELTIVHRPNGLFDIRSDGKQVLSLSGDAILVEKLREMATPKPVKPETVDLVDVPYEVASSIASGRRHLVEDATWRELRSICKAAIAASEANNANA